MVNRNELAKRLLAVNVRDVAALAGVSVKTVYRLRHLENCPGLDVANRLLAAIDKLTFENAKPPRKSRAKVC